MNRLASEKSPYLLQHAGNPVNWYPWSDEAFAAARGGDKPIFLSVGYSTCHWCHVMERESFENPAVAAVLNEHFVAVKVDREERPDVDRIYMTFVQATTGGGGWPMSVWLAPDLRPFYGGTYFPPESRWGRPGFVDILQEIARLWREERPRVLASAESVGEQLSRLAETGRGTSVPPERTLAAAADDFRRSFDGRFGGFGEAPKFPRPSELLFLLREHRRTGSRGPLDIVVRTLHAMSAGGMRDQAGGGFHRYSVDGQWRVPHFEKMLYDQAQLTLALLEAAQASGDRALLGVAEDTLEYVRRDLSDPAGGFYSAEDADSLPPGTAAGGHKAEGAFYVWAAGEIDRLLGADAPLVRSYFGVEEHGNALQDPQGEFRGLNILYQATSPEDAGRRYGLPADVVGAVVARARQILFEARASRPRPHLDDKVLTAWNGLMIAAAARASRVVQALDPGAGGRGASWLAMAERAAAFVRDRMWQAATRRLLRRYRDGEAAIDGFAEDYACAVFGLLELFQASGDAQWLELAQALQRRQDELFWDESSGGWFSTTGDDRSVLMRLKEDYDGAEPAASSVGALNLLALSHLTGDEGAAQRLERTLQSFEPRLTAAPRTVPMMLAVLCAYHAGGEQIVIVGAPGDEATRALERAAWSRYLPFAVHVPVAPGEAASRLAAVLPFVGDLTLRDGRPTAYVCRNFACDRPTGDPAVLASQLDSLV
ncbi:MAG: thioredoxin domain-containing protein [Acidobacteria bacterium]|nr:MAG: thioredoxin domain-containing protein [Acidobacteriota bacterium]